MKHYIILYTSTLAVMAVLDLLWLGLIARGFYEERIGHMLEFKAVPAVIFYLIYITGILTFVSTGSHEDWKTVALYGALFGFFAYATYDLTNLATLKDWPVSITVIDLLWGAFITATSATLGWLTARYFSG